MTVVTEDMVKTATKVLLDRGYTFRYLADNPVAVWLQEPGPMPGSSWWPIYFMSRTEAWGLVWSLYEKEMES